MPNGRKARSGARPGAPILLDTCKAFGYGEKSEQPLELFSRAAVSGQPLPPLADIAFKHYNADMQRAAELVREKRLTADLDEADEVCRRLGLGGLLDRMPAGLQQMVGESGWQLSHGERSRLFLDPARIG